MPLRDFNNLPAYQKLCTDIDKYIATTVTKYIAQKQLGSEAIQQGWDELVSKLLSGKDPNYNLPGSPVAYAFRYLPKKITAMIGILDYCHKIQRPLPKKVLDIGSGTDAVAIALGLAIESNSETVEIRAIEPSDAMREFAFCNQQFQNFSLTHGVGSIEEIVNRYKKDFYSQGTHRHKYFDTITISSALAYNFSDYDDAWWDNFSNALWNLSSDNATLIIVEPYTKSKLLNKKIVSAGQSGWSLYEGQIECLNAMFPNITRQEKEQFLPELTKIKHKLQLNDPYSVTSWNSNAKYVEHICVFYKQNLSNTHQHHRQLESVN